MIIRTTSKTHREKTMLCNNIIDEWKQTTHAEASNFSKMESEVEVNMVISHQMTQIDMKAQNRAKVRIISMRRPYLVLQESWISQTI